MVDLVLFDLWLEHRRYFSNKITRKIIINIYKRYYKVKSVVDFEQYLYELGFDEMIYSPISRYLTNWNYRNEENKLLEKELKIRKGKNE